MVRKYEKKISVCDLGLYDCFCSKHGVIHGTKQEVKAMKVMKWSDKILEIIDCQLRNDDNTMVRGDLQAVVEAVVMNIMDGTDPDTRY
jgi:hypothetical protein